MPSGADNAAEQKPKRGKPTLEEIANLKGLQQEYRNHHDEERELLSIQEYYERRIRLWDYQKTKLPSKWRSKNAIFRQEVVLEDIKSIQPQLENAWGEMTGDKTGSCTKDPTHWKTTYI